MSDTEQMQNEGFYIDNTIYMSKLRLFARCLMGKWQQFYQVQDHASQLCTATFNQLKDCDLITQGFPINRHISDALQLFGDLDDSESFLKLPSNERFNITHEPLSTINILPASPLHSYTCIFRWFNLLVYHLNCRKFISSPTSVAIKTSMKFVQNLVQMETGLKVDQPDPRGGITSTGGVARRAFSNDTKFIECILPLIDTEHRDLLLKIHTQLSAILRIVNSDREINTQEFGILCTNTYLFILDYFPWASITPMLHKLLAHSEEILREVNNGCGLKSFSEEGSEACNKLLRKYRENLARKTSFADNTTDIFVRFASESDPVLLTYRSTLFCSKCGEYGHTKRAKCCKEKTTDSFRLIDELFSSLVLNIE